MGFWDAHTHVQFATYDADRDAVVRRAREAGVRMVNVGTQKDTSARAVALAEQYDVLYAAVGLHPIHTSASFHDADELGGGDKTGGDETSGGLATIKGFTSRAEIFDPGYYRKLSLYPKTVAIGECGLDYFRFNDAEPREEQIKKQKTAFLAQIALAHEVGKPLMIHCRAAFADLIQILKDRSQSSNANAANTNPGIIHFFTGTMDEACELLALGFSFTFGGAITFPPRKGKSAGDYDELIKMIPLDQLLSETDAPYVAPVPHRGKRNEPAYVVEVVKRLAELKNISAEEMCEQIAKNAARIFGIQHL